MQKEGRHVKVKGDRLERPKANKHSITNAPPRTFEYIFLISSSCVEGLVRPLWSLGGVPTDARGIILSNDSPCGYSQKHSPNRYGR